MEDPAQPVLVLALLVDASGDAQIQFKRYDNATGRQLAAGTRNTYGLDATVGAIEDILELGYTPPLRLATRPAPSQTANTRELPCGCVISTTGTAPLKECERHTRERLVCAADQKRRAKL